MHSSFCFGCSKSQIHLWETISLGKSLAFIDTVFLKKFYIFQELSSIFIKLNSIYWLISDYKGAQWLKAQTTLAGDLRVLPSPIYGSTQPLRIPPLGVFSPLASAVTCTPLHIPLLPLHMIKLTVLKGDCRRHVPPTEGLVGHAVLSLLFLLIILKCLLVFTLSCFRLSNQFNQFYLVWKSVGIDSHFQIY